VRLAVALLLGFLSAAPAAARPYPSPNPAVEARIAQRLWMEDNAERAARGLPAMAWDPSLAATAAAWSANDLPLRAVDPPGVQANVIGRGGCPTTAASPCYLTAYLPSDGDAHLGWMYSAGHRANILDPAVVREGIGVFCAPHGVLYATEIFGSSGSSGGSPPPVQPIASPTNAGLTCDGAIRGANNLDHPSPRP
jgi:hypothetical protein